MRKRGVVVWLVATAIATSASAFDAADGKLTLSGFGGWGYGRTAGENAYVVGAENGRYDNAQFTVAVTAHPAEHTVITGQAFLDGNGALALDWAFAEYRFDDLLRVRAGKVKNPLGLFMEVKDVGTLRPFFTLPQTIYGPGSFGAVAYLGAGITGEWENERDWGLQYDLFAGALQIPIYDPGLALGAGPDPVTGRYDFGAIGLSEENARDVVGGRVALSTPIEGLTFRLSGFTGTFVEPDGNDSERVSCYGVSAEWAIDRLQLRGELFREDEGELETNVAGYVEVAWSVLPKLQLALRYEQSTQEKEGIPADSSLNDHLEGAIGVAYWASPSLVFKASYHLVDGNRFALPVLSRADGTVARRTDLIVAGVQFAF